MLAISLHWYSWDFIGHKLTNYVGNRIAHLTSDKFLRAFIPLGIVLAADLLHWGWQGSAMRKLVKPSKSSRTDLVCWVLAITQLDFLLKLAFTFGTFYIILWLSDAYRIRVELPGVEMNPVLRFIVMLAVFDLVSYWRHRIEHKVEGLWAFHKFHHSASEFNTLSGTREHPVSALYLHVVDRLPLLLIGVAMPDLLVPTLVLKTVQILHHTNLPWNWGWFGKHVIYPPVGHRLHHSNDPRHFNCNLANMFVFWDKLFGTWNGDYMEKDFMARCELGVPQSQYNQKGTVADYFVPFVELFRKPVLK